MAKPLVVVLHGHSVSFELEKIERSKLYGYVETEVVDDTGKRCELATLIADGHSVVGKGGTALAYLSPDGTWRKKADLKPVDIRGNAITPVKSTFDAPVNLDAKATVQEYLSHNIQLIYRLTPDEEHLPLRNELQLGTIFQFPFSYRGGIEASAGFLLLGSEGDIFLCVGTPTAAQFVGLESTAAVAEEGDSGLADDDDALDFGIL